MPERQPSSGEATEQQVTGPVAPDDSARDDAAPHGAGPDGSGPESTRPEGAGAEGAGAHGAGSDGAAGSSGTDADGADRASSAGDAASGTPGPAPADPARPSPAPRPTMPASRVAAGAAPEMPAADAPARATPERDAPARATPAQDAPPRAMPQQDASARTTPGQDAPPRATPQQDAPARATTGQDAPPRATTENDAPARTTSPDAPAPERSGQATGRTGGPTAATPAPSTPAPSASAPSTPAPSAQAHDGVTPSPTAPGADPGPQARGGMFTPPARGSGPTTPAGPAPAAGRSGNVPPTPGAGSAPSAAPPAPVNGSQAGPTVPPAGSRPGPGAPGGDRPPAGTRPADAPPGNGPGNGPSAGGAELFGSWDDESTRVLPRVPGGSEASTQRMRAAGPAAGAGATAAMAATGPMARGPAGPGPGSGGPAPAGPGGPGAGGAVPAASGPAGPSGGGDGPTGQDPDAGDGSGRRPRRTGLLIAAGVVGIIVLAYLGDLLFSSGSVPRGVTVAGQQIGGLSRAAAIERLQATIEPRSGQPVQVTAGPVRSEIDPKTAGLSVDYDGTLDQAGAQPLNPITRISSFFTNRDVGVVNKADERSVRTALEQLVPVVDREPKDGTVRFDGLNPVPVEPVPGQRLDVDRAVGTLEQQWASGAPVALPLIIEPAATTPGDVQQAIDDVAKPAVSGPLTVTGEGANATVAPEDIAEALTFEADPNGAQKLVPQLNIESITDVVTPQLEKTEKPGVDATLDFASNPPKVVPSQDGRGIDYKASFANLLPVLTGPGPRTVAAVYTVKPPDITTAKIQSLGSAGEISTFTTGGFSADSGQNIKRAAEAIDGQIVAPGETFSLDAATNPRDASRGYVEAGIIEDGAPARGIGGGVSQLATTLYNASYFAGMVDVEHKEHSYYISRYPAAREATVFDDIIDVKFRNDGPTAVLIKTAWTPSNVTVTFFGTKRYDVTSSSGPRTNYTDPQVVNIPAGQPCSPSKGAPGFTATDTRTMRDLQTGETTSKTRTVKYNPQPIVRCGG